MNETLKGVLLGLLLCAIVALGFVLAGPEPTVRYVEYPAAVTLEDF